MNVEELKRLLEKSTEEDIEFDEPHISLRCQENDTTKEKIMHILLHEAGRLSHVVQDRPNVYKIYFKLSERRQLKLIIDTIKRGRIMVRTVKILDRKLYKKIKFIRRGRQR
mgnify:FL=1